MSDGITESVVEGCSLDWLEAILGKVVHYFPQPQRGCISVERTDGRNPFRVYAFSKPFPRVARASQPWAERHYPVGVKDSRTLAALRNALLSELLSGGLRVPAAAQAPEAHA